MDYPDSPDLFEGKFTDGDPVAGRAASVASAEHMNAVYDELINVITFAGGTPDVAIKNQLKTALEFYRNASNLNAGKVPMERLPSSIVSVGVIVATGTATLTSINNNINLIGVGLGVDVGDVISISGSANSDALYTIDVITGDDDIIVNKAHAGKSLTYVSGSRTKTLDDEEADVTVTLVCPWYFAGKELGRDWVSILETQFPNVPYSNNGNRAMQVTAAGTDLNRVSMRLEVNGEDISYSTSNESEGNQEFATVDGAIPAGAVYEISYYSNASAPLRFFKLMA